MAQMFNDENFEKEVLKSDIPVLVDFFAEWCGPCKMMGPVIEKLAEEYEGKWKIGKLDVDQAPKTSETYSVQSIPTLLFFKDGKVVNMSVGFQAKEKIVAKLV
ncbi:MAG: thioredoxin [Candidatus Peregrinibacteria bacterium]|nr:thioredoxin [Candidatus Peregrinibacteria bacterium]